MPEMSSVILESMDAKERNTKADVFSGAGGDVTFLEPGSLEKRNQLRIHFAMSNKVSLNDLNITVNYHCLLLRSLWLEL